MLTRFMSMAVVLLAVLAAREAPAAPPAGQAANPNVWVEDFGNPFAGWQDRWFYKYTNAEGYYVLCGSPPTYRPSDQQGIWIGARGKDPTASLLTVEIKPSLGLEATYFSFGVNSHVQQLSIRFLDKDGKTIAVSCAPRTGYYHYVTVAVKISKGLSAIQFDGHGTQVSGNVNINHVEAVFGPVPADKRVRIHEIQKGQCLVLPEEPTRSASPR